MLDALKPFSSPVLSETAFLYEIQDAGVVLPRRVWISCGRSSQRGIGEDAEPRWIRRLRGIVRRDSTSKSPYGVQGIGAGVVTAVAAHHL